MKFEVCIEDPSDGSIVIFEVPFKQLFTIFNMSAINIDLEKKLVTVKVGKHREKIGIFINNTVIILPRTWLETSHICKILNCT